MDTVDTSLCTAISSPCGALVVSRWNFNTAWECSDTKGNCLWLQPHGQPPTPSRNAVTQCGYALGVPAWQQIATTASTHLDPDMQSQLHDNNKLRTYVPPLVRSLLQGTQQNTPALASSLGHLQTAAPPWQRWALRCMDKPPHIVRKAARSHRVKPKSAATRTTSRLQSDLINTAP